MKHINWLVIGKTLLSGIGLGVIYWLAVSLIYAFLFQEGDFLEGLLPSQNYHVWERLIAVILLSLVHVSMHYSTYGHRSIRARLSASEAKYRNLFETMAQGVVYHDSKGKVISANPSAIEILGVSVERMSRHTVTEPTWEAIHEDGTDFPGKDHPAIIALSTGKEVKNVVMGIYNPVERRHRWINISATPQFEPGSSRPFQAFATFDDITIPKEMEKKLKESEEFSSGLLDNAPNPITVLNSDGSVRYVNPAFEELTGYSREEVTGLVRPFPWWPNSMKECYISEDAVRGGNVFLINGVRRYTKKSGEEFWIILNVRNVEENGELKYFLTTWLDITQRKRSEEALQQSEQKLKKVFESVADGVIIMDISGRMIDCNDNAVNLLNYPSKAELSAIKLADMITSENQSNTLQRILDIHNERLNQDLNCTCRRKDNSRFPAEVSSRVARDNSGKPLFVVISFRDITGRKAMEDRIVELYEKEKGQREELQEEARMRGLFIDILAHELRNPLTPILVSSSMLKSSLKEPGVYHKLVNNICDGAETLSTRLEELLDLARYSRGQFNLKKQSINLRVFLEDVATRFSPGLSASNQKLILDLPDDKTIIEIDPSRLEQVIINLLSNASKFSASGGRIEIKARFRDKTALIEVKDEGIGISAEDQERIFKPYHRVKQEYQKIPGLGLGLAVSKQIVEAHGGKIRVTSQSGCGSTFSILLPNSEKAETPNKT
jgi:PAS domain S-box-containing protein